jgi:hypothetical protein
MNDKWMQCMFQTLEFVSIELPKQLDQVRKIPCVVWCCKLVVRPPHQQLLVHNHCQMVEAPGLIFKHYQSMDVP